MRLFLFLLIIIGLPAHALNSFEGMSSISDLKVEKYMDTQGISFEALRSLPAEAWTHLKARSHQAHFLSSDYWGGSAAKTLWLKITLPKRIKNDSIWLEFVPNVGLDGQLAEKNGDHWFWRPPVDRQRLKETKFPSNFLTFELKAKDAHKTAYIKLNSSQIYHFSINVRTEDQLIWYTLKSNLFNGIIIGFLLLALIYSLSIGISASERVYLYYAFFVFCNATYLIVISGYPRLLFPEWGGHGSLSNLSVLLALFAGTVFVKEFVETKKYTPIADKALSIQRNILFVGIISAALVSNAYGYMIAEILGLFAPIIILGSGIAAFKAGQELAKYFLLAWTFFLSCAVVWGWMWFGLIEPRLWVLELFKIGVLFEVALLSLVLGHRYSRLKKQTFNLNEEKNRFEQLSETDELTGVLNRRGFLKYAQSLDISNTNEIIWLVLDIDHFKEFNDLHGHYAGDKLLSEFGTILSDKSRRETLALKLMGDSNKIPYRKSIAGRIGGEEFAVILSDCTIPQARLYAERLVREFENICVLNDYGEEVGATLSVGGAEIRPGEMIENLWRRAESHLHDSKLKGRSQVNIL